MAGIGFDLLRLVNQGSYRSLLTAYGLTTLMSSGPSIFILLGISIVCFFNMYLISDTDIAYQFLSIIIYLFSSSMILSSLLQYTFFRFIADRVYVREFNEITPNYIGVLLVQTIISAALAIPMVMIFFSPYTFNLRVMLVANFIILNMIWISTVLLTGIKSYRQILWAFFLGYISMIIVHLLADRVDLEFLLFDFLLAQIILFILLLHAILTYYPTNIIIKFSFLKRDNIFFSLIFSNFFSTLGFWVDKYIFWFNKATGYVIFAPLRASPLYDFPMFIAYLGMIPAMAVFLFQIEARFSMVYPHFMRTIFNKKPLSEIVAVRNELTLYGRNSLISILKTQYAVVVMLFLSIPFIFSVLHIIPVYMPLLFILIIATSLNVILWGALNILYYMTRYPEAVYISIIFLISNTLFTLISLYLGPAYYGYGLCLSLLLSVSTALFLLNRAFKLLEYNTFMMAD